MASSLSTYTIFTRLQPAGILLLTLLASFAATPVPPADLGSTPGTVRSYSTVHSIGIEWDISGDANHDATIEVKYRVQDSDIWNDALPLVRVDDNGYNMLAGSILFLSPNTTYEVKLNLSDPDGGADRRIITVATRAVPALPTSGRTFHVVPGSGGGDGSSANPFQGIPAAQAAAQPGDVFLLHTGSYGGRIAFDVPGTPGRYIAWKGAGDGEVLLDGIDIAASHVWLEALTVKDQAFATFSVGAPQDVVISRCRFINNNYSIYLQQGGRNWYIADNIIVGDTPSATESFLGEGIQLHGAYTDSDGHVVAHNSITNVADGISNGDYNIDVFGNDIYDVSDDGFEGDAGRANIRIWGNRIHNAVHNGISFQPQESAPWYILRNQLVSFKESPFKFRTTDRSVIAHNTIVNWGKMSCCSDAHLLRSIVRNNLWVSVSGGQIWDFGSSVKDWRTDFDHNGFDWGDSVAPFRYGGVTFPTLTSFSTASGLETRGRQIDKNTCFESFNVPGPPLTSVPQQYMTLNAGCSAIDAGARLPNINDDFLGTAADLGAYELGQRLPTYGPRLPDTAPPSVAITTPLDGAHIRDVITLAASAADDVGVAGVQFQLDEANLGLEDTTGPYSIPWDTTTAVCGSHTLTAVARDSSGNTGVSSAITTTVVDTTRPVLYVSPDLLVPCKRLSADGRGCAKADDPSIAAWLRAATATDTCDPAPTVSHNAPVVFPIGETTVTFHALDAAGNASTQPAHVRVVYTFGGFLPPLGGKSTQGQTTPVTFTEGETIPVKFTLRCGWSPVGTAVATIAVFKLLDAATGAMDTVDLTQNSGSSNDGTNLFRYDPTSGKYIYKLSTRGLAAPATYRIVVALDDGTQQIADFSLVCSWSGCNTPTAYPLRSTRQP